MPPGQAREWQVQALPGRIFYDLRSSVLKYDSGQRLFGISL